MNIHQLYHNCKAILPVVDTITLQTSYDGENHSTRLFVRLLNGKQLSAKSENELIELLINYTLPAEKEKVFKSLPQFSTYTLLENYKEWSLDPNRPKGYIINPKGQYREIIKITDKWEVLGEDNISYPCYPTKIVFKRN